MVFSRGFERLGRCDRRRTALATAVFLSILSFLTLYLFASHLSADESVASRKAPWYRPRPLPVSPSTSTTTMTSQGKSDGIFSVPNFNPTNHMPLLSWQSTVLIS